MQAYNLFLSCYSSLWASFTLQACPKVLILIALFYVSVESLCKDLDKEIAKSEFVDVIFFFNPSLNVFFISLKIIDVAFKRN